jgi:hypothetical protein
MSTAQMVAMGCGVMAVTDMVVAAVVLPRVKPESRPVVGAALAGGVLTMLAVAAAALGGLLPLDG